MFHLLNNYIGKSMNKVKLFLITIILIGLGGCISYSSKEEKTAAPAPASTDHNRGIADPY
jgi:hypothetical protein